jgi:hypothetical protein
MVAQVITQYLPSFDIASTGLDAKCARRSLLVSYRAFPDQACAPAFGV